MKMKKGGVTKAINLSMITRIMMKCQIPNRARSILTRANSKSIEEERLSGHLRLQN